MTLGLSLSMRDYSPQSRKPFRERAIRGATGSVNQIFGEATLWDAAPFRVLLAPKRIAGRLNSGAVVCFGG